MDIKFMVQIFNIASIETMRMYDENFYEQDVKEFKGGIYGQKNECCIR